MTRFKEYVRKNQEIWLENDYPFMPYTVGSMTLEGVSAVIEDNKIVVRKYYTSIVDKIIIDKYGNKEYDLED